jgi:hypothetical protein
MARYKIAPPKAYSEFPGDDHGNTFVDEFTDDTQL